METEFTLKKGESFYIGSNVKIEYRNVETGSKQVNLGIEAPREVAVHREEIFNRIKAGEPKPDKQAKAKVETKIIRKKNRKLTQQN